MTLRTLACASALALLSSTALAQDPGSYYASVKVLGTLSNFDVGLKGESTELKLYDDAPEIVGGPSIAVGYRMKNWPVRMELEWIWRYRYDMDASTSEATPRVFKANVSTQSLYWNGYYEVPLTERLFTKGTAFGYAGAGIGIALNNAEGTAGTTGGVAEAVDNTEVDFTWMVTFGMRYHLTKRWIVDVSYRFTDLGGMDMGETRYGQAVSTSTYYSHDLLIGMAYAF